MKKYVTVIPLWGIVLDGEPIELGCTRAEVERVLGEPEREFAPNKFNPNTQLCYFEANLCFDINPDGRVDFIDFLGRADGMVQPEIYGVKAFEVGADEVIELLKSKNNGAVDSLKEPYDFAFIEISVGVYRESIPADVDEMIAEAERAGNPMSAEDIRYERSISDHWNTLGIGGAGYYKKFKTD